MIVFVFVERGEEHEELTPKPLANSLDFFSKPTNSQVLVGALK
jgi:hypothetical protein